MGFVHVCKQWVETALGVRIYRTATPLGMDLGNDLRRIVPQFQPQVIFDVGANVGQTSLRFNSLWPDADIYAFEPVTATHEKLRQAVAGRSKVHCVRMALSDQVGQADIHIASDSVQSTFNPTLPQPGALSGKTETVHMTTAEQWCESNGIAQIDFLKVDAEGHDLHVLRGAAALFERQKVGPVLVEIHLGTHVDPTLEAIRSWLEPYGFVPSGIYDLQGFASKKILWANFLFLPSRMLRQ